MKNVGNSNENDIGLGLILPLIAQKQDIFQDLQISLNDPILKSSESLSTTSTSLKSISQVFFTQFNILQTYIRNIVKDNLISNLNSQITKKKLQNIGLGFLKFNQTFKLINF